MNRERGWWGAGIYLYIRKENREYERVVTGELSPSLSSLFMKTAKKAQRSSTSTIK